MQTLIEAASKISEEIQYAILSQDDERLSEKLGALLVLMNRSNKISLLGFLSETELNEWLINFLSKSPKTQDRMIVI